LMWVKFP